MQDDFGAAVLDAAWTEENIGSPGPTVSLTARPGYLRLVVPGGQPYDNWVAQADAPSLTRTDMGGGNFAIETALDLTSFVDGAPFQVGLALVLGTYDVLLWGIVGGAGRLEASRSGTPALTVFERWGRTETRLRLEKSGSVYTFFHKAAVADRWVCDGQYRDALGASVQAVGLMAKTWTPTGSAITVDVDDFGLVTGTTASDDGANSGDAQTFGSICTRYVPLAGPLLVVPPNVPGQGTAKKNFRVLVPGDRAYDHWTAVDDAPQLLRDDLGDGDWAVETVATLVYADGGSFHSGLLVRFGRYDAYYWGFNQSTDLQLDRSGTPNVARVTSGAPRVWLRVERAGGQLVFRHRANPQVAWQSAATVPAAGPVEAVGLVAKTWAANALAVDFGYLRLTRPPLDAGDNGAGLGHTDTFGSTTLDAAWTARVPVAGPAYSLTSRPGRLAWQLPGDRSYDHWTGVDAAPSLARVVPAGADWVAQTKVRLPDTAAGAYHAGLAVQFSDQDWYYWGFDTGTLLQLDRTGSQLVADAANSAPVVHLRVTKTQDAYEFAFRRPADLIWTVVATTTTTTAPQSVALFAKTWAPTSLSVEFDYLDLTLVDHFTGSGPATQWTAEIPVAGPTVVQSGGSLTIDVPGTGVFDHWTGIAQAPHLSRDDMGGGDWAISTAASVAPVVGAFHTGLFVRFGTDDEFYWGFDGGTRLQLDRSGTPGLAVIENAGTECELGIEKIGSSYLFLYRTRPGAPFRLAGTVAGAAGTVVRVGLVLKTWLPTAVSAQFSSFTLQQRAVL